MKSKNKKIICLENKFQELKIRILKAQDVFIRESLIIEWLRLKSIFKSFKGHRFFCKRCLTPLQNLKTVELNKETTYVKCLICYSKFKHGNTEILP